MVAVTPHFNDIKMAKEIIDVLVAIWIQMGLSPHPLFLSSQAFCHADGPATYNYKAKLEPTVAVSG
jgi:hypothetical protein